MIREVVDGQQRIAAILDYMDGGYTLSKTLDAAYAGKKFAKLSGDEQDSIRSYGFICEILHGFSDAEVLELFARINSYSVPLNAQELRNGTYFGFFKQTAYRLAYDHVEFWRRHHIFSEYSIARMLEVELTSELMIMQLDGFQDKKKSINRFYSDNDTRFDERRTVESQFRTVLDVVEESIGNHLENSEFRRPPLFYSLCGVIHHRMYGLPKQTLPTPRKRLNEEERSSLRNAVLELSDKIASAREGEPVMRDYQNFVNACLRQTDNIQPRQTRFAVLYTEAF
jgi:hypothetical protein